MKNFNWEFHSWEASPFKVLEVHWRSVYVNLWIVSAITFALSPNWTSAIPLQSDVAQSASHSFINKPISRGRRKIALHFTTPRAFHRQALYASNGISSRRGNLLSKLKKKKRDEEQFFRSLRKCAIKINFPLTKTKEGKARRSEAEIKEKSWVLYVSFRIYYYASEKSVAKASVA